MPRWTVAVIALCFSVAASGQVMLRTLPGDAKRGKLTAIELGSVRIDGKTYRMSPGARILNANNMTVTPNQVAADTVIRYQLDGQGQVRTIWMLTPEEAKRR